MNETDYIDNDTDHGRLANEYEIYKTNAESLGWYVKTFDEWLNS